MLRRLELAVVAAACSAMLISCGCRRGSEPPKIIPLVAGKAAIKQYDANKAGTNSADELKKNPALKAEFKKVGSDNVAAEKIAARIQSWLDSPEGVKSVHCAVRLNGRPLAGATVTFIPEEFLGVKLPTASATTDPRGKAVMSAAGSPPERLGVIFCGFYRVEISKKEGGAETIPAKYNTQTTLGQEVAQDADGIFEGIVFDLFASP